ECAMSTSPLYDSIRAALQQHLPSVIDSQIASLGLAIVGAVESMSSQMAKIARAMPLDTTELAKEQRLRRLLDNARLTQADHYQPIVQHSLHGLKGQRVQLLIDRVLLRDQHNILDVCVGCRRRSLPLVWRALAPRGCAARCMVLAGFVRASCLAGCARGAMTPCWGFGTRCGSTIRPIRSRMGSPWRRACKRCRRRRPRAANASTARRQSPSWPRST